MTAVVMHTNGATAEETPQRQCIACDTVFAAGSGHGDRYCGRRCATIHGNQMGALAPASELVEDFDARLQRAIALQLDQVLALTVTEAVEAVVPEVVQDEVAAVVPAAVAEALAKQMESLKASHVPACDKPPTKSLAVANEETERAVQAIARRLHDLPTGWQQLTVVRGPNGFTCKVLY